MTWMAEMSQKDDCDLIMVIKKKKLKKRYPHSAKQNCSCNCQILDITESIITLNH